MCLSKNDLNNWGRGKSETTNQIRFKLNQYSL